MKKIILASFIAALASGASASIINNDVTQSTALDLQANAVVKIGALNFGNTILSGTNLINTSTTNLVGTNLILGNDVTQTAANTVQLNGVVSLGGLTVGNIEVTGVNSANSSEVTLGSTGFVAVVGGNDVDQTANSVFQANGILDLSLIRGGSLTVDGTNLVNTSSVSINSTGLLASAVGLNTIAQEATDVTQLNTIVVGSLVRGGAIDLTGVNSANSSKLDITSTGFFSIVGGNITEQNATDVTQVNSVLEFQGGAFGPVTVDGTNLVNTASTSITANGFFDLVAFNPIIQDADSISQTNSITSNSFIRFTNFDLTGVNAINSASLEIDTTGLASGIIGNSISQTTSGLITQSNTIEVNAAVSGGPITLDGTNLINTASSTINSTGFGVVGFNSITQTASPAIQLNSVDVNGFAHVGPITLDGINSINSATLDITGSNIAFNNSIDQLSGGNVQANVVTVGPSVVTGGPITVTGVNSINSASLSITQ